MFLTLLVSAERPGWAPLTSPVRKRLVPSRLAFVAAWLLVFGFVRAAQSAPLQHTNGPAEVEIRHAEGRYQLYVNGAPVYIKGAGLEQGSQEALAEHGGNSFRTWRPGDGRETGQEMLDRAERNGLYVTMGLVVTGERHGFDYNNPVAVSNQLVRIRGQVLKYRNHPALLIWAIGNELNLSAHNPKVWDAVNDISRMIHELDPNHLTTSPVAGLSRALVQELKTRAPDLDLLSVQMYADIVNLPRHLRESGWDGPYMVTEWGATGHWEVGKTSWGAPLENDSQTKADSYQARYQVIAADRTQCVGSYVFLWGQKQERTPTWYGMFLATGEETPAVDALHYCWTGAWPANRSPRLETMELDGKQARANIHLQADQTYSASVQASDPDHDPLTYSWVVLEESTDLKTGGDFETKPKSWPACIEQPTKNDIRLKAPSKPGAYRLFAYVFDGKGHAAHANIPFFVDSVSKVTQK